MSATKRTSRALALLISKGAIGISSALAATFSTPMQTTDDQTPIAERLGGIREAVSVAMRNPSDPAREQDGGAKLMLAKWLNFGGGMGWRNGGWRNWHNGGWGNGGWHNGGWGNGGWGNGWHNFWHNW